MANKKGLLLTYVFPPMALPEAYLVGKRCAALDGIELDVLTVPPYQRWMGEDKAFSQFSAPKFGKVERMHVSSFLKILPFWRLGILSRIPDSARFLNSSFLKRASNLVSEGAYDFIFTWSQWHSVHLVGHALKRRNPSMKWIAHFSDPWVDNPYRKDGWLSRTLNMKLEQKIVTSADQIVCTNPQTSELLAKHSSLSNNEKFLALPHGYAPELYPSSADSENTRTKNQKIVIRYLGGLYGNRNPEHFIDALNSLISEGYEDELKKLKVEFIGPVEMGIQESCLEKIQIQGLVEFLPPVEYLKSLFLMKSSDWLLLIDAPSEKNLFLPSKLIDYIGAKRPIFALTPVGLARDILTQTGAISAMPNDREEIKEGILKIAQIGKHPEDIVLPSEVEKTYSIIHQAPRFSAIVEKMCESNIDP